MRQLAIFAARLAARNRSRARLTLPTLWLLTDAVRLSDPVAAAARLPRGSGVIVRHTDACARRVLAERLMAVARRRGLVCLVAGDWRLAQQVGADGVHLPEQMAIRNPTRAGAKRRGALLTVAAHGARGLARAAALDADAVLVAPVFPTRSHPGRRTLGPVRLAQCAQASKTPVIALGGISAKTVARLPGRIAGIAAVGALGGDERD